MIATQEDWTEMGTGESGPMYHMTFGGLSFEGPMGEAMSNMGPFASFLIKIFENQSFFYSFNFFEYSAKRQDFKSLTETE
jgi:hypothetical protein